MALYEIKVWRKPVKGSRRGVDPRGHWAFSRMCPGEIADAKAEALKLHEANKKPYAVFLDGKYVWET